MATGNSWRIQVLWWAWVSLVVGVLGSEFANTGHILIEVSEGRLGGVRLGLAVGLGVLPPLLVLLVIKLATMMPWPRMWQYGLARWGGSLVVLALSWYVSWRQISDLLRAEGYTDVGTLWLYPIAIDGFMTVAFAAIMALHEPGMAGARRPAVAALPVAAAPVPVPRPVGATAPVGTGTRPGPGPAVLNGAGR